MRTFIPSLQGSLPARLARGYGRSKAGSYAAALAFNGFMTMFPLILGLLSVVGLVLHDQSVQARLQDLIIGVFPQGAHSELEQALNGVKQHAGLLGLVSLGGMLWGGTSFFVSIEFALTQIFGTDQRSMVRQRLMGAVMILVFLAALLLTAGASVTVGSGLPFGRILGFVVGALVLVVLFVVIYRYVPNRSFRLSEVLPGALIAGLLTEVLTLVFPLYAHLSRGFNTYGQQFALFFVLATWMYLLSQLLLFGAVFNRMRLGAPRERGILAEREDSGQPPPRPADAIEAERAETL